MKFDSIISVTLVGNGLFFGAEAAQAAPERADCVGRLEILLPSDADVAAYSFERFSKEVRAGSGQPHFQFDCAAVCEWNDANFSGISSAEVCVAAAGG